MNISIATSTKEPNGIIPDNLHEANYLFIVDTDKFEAIRIIKAAAEKPDVFFARETIKHDCEAIICGEIEQEAFEIIAGASVSRYLGSGVGASHAVKMFEEYRLPLIREYKGGPGCAGESAHRECHEHDHGDEDE